MTDPPVRLYSVLQYNSLPPLRRHDPMRLFQSTTVVFECRWNYFSKSSSLHVVFHHPRQSSPPAKNACKPTSRESCSASTSKTNTLPLPSYTTHLPVPSIALTPD
jgi:hypothetical protein